MNRRLPPLSSLKFFEAAAIHLSFTKAADELCVTNAAVSHQIKQLESFLGTALFKRRNNQLELTVSGETYLPRIRDVFRALEEATNMLMEDRTSLRVAVPQILGAKWLVPRLYRFYNLHPNIRVEITTQDTIEYQQFDLCIDDRQVDDKELVIETLMCTGFSPVCHPDLAESIQSVRDLSQHTLLHDRSSRRLTHHPSWQRWLDEITAGDIEAGSGLGFSEPFMALQAAIDGQGLALSQNILVEYDMAAGRLTRPLSNESSLRLCYYIITMHKTPNNPDLDTFRNWLLTEASI